MFPNFDPSKLDPKVLMELSQLVSQLPPDKLNRMQTLMHNMMAGFDVKAEMEEFEKSLPPGFREKVAQIMLSSGANPFAAFGGAPGGSASPAAGATSAAMPTAASAAPASEEVLEPEVETEGEMDMRRARLTILRAVADGQMSPEEAEKLLFAS